MEDEKTTTENVNDNKEAVKDEVVDKTAIVEKVAEELKKEVEKQQAEIAQYKAKLGEEAKAKLKDVPEEIRQRYKGIEIDLKTVENIDKDVATHKAMENAAKAEAQKQIDEYKKTVFEKYGVKLPDSATVATPATKEKVKNQNEDGKKVTRFTDIAEKEKLSLDDLKAITSNHENMKKYMEERRKIIHS